MPDVLEYTYEDRPDHLTEREALDRYARMRRDHPHAFVVLRDLDCGHWQVRTYETDAEKNGLLRKTYASMVRTFWSAFRLAPKAP